MVLFWFYAVLQRSDLGFLLTWYCQEFSVAHLILSKENSPKIQMMIWALCFCFVEHNEETGYLTAGQRYQANLNWHTCRQTLAFTWPQQACEEFSMVRQHSRRTRLAVTLIAIPNVHKTSLWHENIAEKLPKRKLLEWIFCCSHADHPMCWQLLSRTMFCCQLLCTSKHCKLWNYLQAVMNILFDGFDSWN